MSDFDIGQLYKDLTGKENKRKENKDLFTEEEIGKIEVTYNRERFEAKITEKNIYIIRKV